MSNKPKLYRISSEGKVYLGSREEVNKLPEEHKTGFLAALQKASEGETPPPIVIPPGVLTEAGFKSEADFLESQPKPELEPFKGGARQPMIQPPSSFVDILADKVADRILKRLLGG